jgi:hypothetical protein
MFLVAWMTSEGRRCRHGPAQAAMSFQNPKILFDHLLVKIRISLLQHCNSNIYSLVTCHNHGYGVSQFEVWISSDIATVLSCAGQVPLWHCNDDSWFKCEIFSKVVATPTRLSPGNFNLRLEVGAIGFAHITSVTRLMIGSAPSSWHAMMHISACVSNR